jgi:hypothetical protein
VAGLPNAQRVDVHGHNTSRVQAFAQPYTAAGLALIRVLADLDTLLDNPKVDAGYVAPRAQHGAPVQAALLRGKPVLCEKPLMPNQAPGLGCWVLQQAWGTCPVPTQRSVHGRLAPTGVDMQLAATLGFESSRLRTGDSARAL